MKRSPLPRKRATLRREGHKAPRIKPSANIRSKALRDLARDCPKCMSCGNPNDGTVVGCHPYGIKRGHGMGQKAHDVLAYCCRECHDLIDGRMGSLTPFERENLWLDAFYWSTVWLIQTGRLEVKP